MKKKILSIFMVLVVGATLMPMEIWAVDIIDSGYCGGEGDGTNLTWTMDSEGVLTISGQGSMADFKYDSAAPWYRYRESITNISIGDRVKSIGEYAFQYLYELTNISFSSSVAKIGDGAFLSCENLSQISFPSGLMTIGNSAFSHCENLTRVNLPSNLIEVDDYAFVSCWKLTDIAIPDSVKTIGYSAFGGCISLKSFSVGEDNSCYSNDDCGALFDKEHKTLIQYPAGNDRSSYTIPSGVTSIAPCAFGAAENLEEIVIPNSVNSIGMYAFDACSSLPSLLIPDSVSDIGQGAFNFCSSLSSLRIPNGVSSLGFNFFDRCSNLQYVTIPQSVKSIASDAFAYCDNLTDIYYAGEEMDWASISIDSSNSEYLSKAEIHYSSKTPIIASGYCGGEGDNTNLVWTLDCDGLLTISGTGRMADYTRNDERWNKQVNEIRSIQICEGVTSIGDMAFMDCSNLLNVVLPNSVSSIGSATFRDCLKLTEISIPKNVRSIEPYTFCGCEELAKVLIPNGVRDINKCAFSYCSKLSNISIPESVNSIGERAFRYCEGMTNIVIPNGVTSIGPLAFSYCRKLISIEIPSSVNEINEYMFYDCSNLTEITIPNSVSVIREYAFAGCSSLSEIAIPKSVTSIGFCAFASCSNISSFEVDADNQNYCSDSQGVLFNKEKTELIQYPNANSSDVYMIQEGVEKIDNYAFMGSTNLTSLLIDKSVIEIRDSAFYNCINLQTVYYSGNKSEWEEMSIIDGNNCLKNADIKYVKSFGYCGEAMWTLDENGLLTIFGHGSMGNYNMRRNKAPWLRWNKEISTVVIEKGVTDIGDYAFHFCGLKNITIPDSVTKIGKGAFYECYYLEEVSIPENVITIGVDAFFECVGLTEIHIPSRVESIDFDDLNSKNSAFTLCRGLSKITVSEDNPTFSCDENGVLFDKQKTTLIQYPIGNTRTSYEIPSGVTYIGMSAFQNATNLTSVSIPDGALSVGESAFRGCEKLTHISMPDSLADIGDHAFHACTALQEIHIPDKITVLSAYAFDQCSSISEVILPTGLAAIRNHAFSYCAGLQKISIPDTVTVLDANIFEQTPDVCIHCSADSSAHQYAMDNDIPFELFIFEKLKAPDIFMKNHYTQSFLNISAEERANIYYTLDGSDPTKDSTLYEAPISLHYGEKMILRAICAKEGWFDSDSATYSFTGKRASAPTSSVADGSRVDVCTEIEFESDTEGAEIWFATNGYDPVEDNPARQLYTGPLLFDTPGEEVMVKVMAYKEGYLPSISNSYTYSITEKRVLPQIEYTKPNVTANSVEVGAVIEGDEIQTVKIHWWDVAESDITMNKEFSKPESNEIHFKLPSLEPDTTYVYFIEATNSAGTSVGEFRSFTTPEASTEYAYVELKDRKVELYVGHTHQLCHNVLKSSDGADDTVFWMSDDNKVATVDGGKITGVASGTATITAKLINGSYDTCTVTVREDDNTGQYDFSEKHMITHSFQGSACGKDVSLQDGGNALMATAYLARWEGAVLESVDPYPKENNPTLQNKDLTDDEMSEYVKHVQNVIFLPARQNALDNNEIKAAIMEYGAVYTSFYLNPAYYSDSKQAYYCSDKKTYLDPNDCGQYHAVAIVGWDDTYSKYSFKKSNRPNNNGAFICRDSKGENEHGDGYFYISYEDSNLGYCYGDLNAVFLKPENSEKYNKNYQYDFFGPTQIYEPEKGKTGIYQANVFPEQGKSLAENEWLQAVSFYNYTPGTSYRIYVIKNYEGPSSLTDLGAPVSYGTIDYMGYFTKDINSILLEKGTRFAVIVELEDSKIFLEARDRDNGYSKVEAGSDQSYIKVGDGLWKDLTETEGNKQSNVCVKAFTFTNGPQTTQFGTEKPKNESVSLMSSYGSLTSDMGLRPSILPALKKKTDTEKGIQIPKNYDPWKEDGGLMPVRDQGNIPGCWSFAAYASLESAILHASTKNIRSNTSAGDSSLTLNEDNLTVAVGDHIQLLAAVSGNNAFDSFIWDCDGDAASVSPHGFVTAERIGTATVTVQTADGALSKSCEITVKEPVPVQTLSILNDEATIVAGKMMLMQYEAAPGNADKSVITWESSDPSVAEIDSKGCLHALGEGYVTLTVSSPDGSVSDSYELFVEGKSCVMEVDEHTLQVTGGVLQGNLTLKLTNQNIESENAEICLAVYTSNGQLAQMIMQEESLTYGIQQITLQDVNVPVSTETGVRIKLFIVDACSHEPLAPAVEEVLE